MPTVTPPRCSATSTTTADMHARDSDTIVGDNGDILRIVGIGGATGGDVAGCNGDKMCLSKLNPTVPGTPSTVLRHITYNFDNFDPSVTSSYSPNGKIVVRGVSLLDYIAGGPDFRPDLFGLGTNGVCSTSPATGACGTQIPTCHGLNFNSSTGTFNDVGGSDEIHAESGDDFVYGGVGNDVLFGEGQDDEIVGGYGNDWISGGTGDDGVIGDDGRISTSRNSSDGYTWNNATASWVKTCAGNAAGTCLAEPLNGIQALLPTDPDTKFSNGNVLNEFIYTPGQVQTATINVAGVLNKSINLTPFNVDGADQPLFDANSYDDIIFGGWGNDFLHGGSGDDAISGAEALPTAYVQLYGTTRRAARRTTTA